MSNLGITCTKQLANFSHLLDQSSKIPSRLLDNDARLVFAIIDKDGVNLWWPGVQFRTIEQMMKSFGDEQTSVDIKQQKSKLFLEILQKRNPNQKGPSEVIHLLARDTVLFVSDCKLGEVRNFSELSNHDETAELGGCLWEEAYEDAWNLSGPLPFAQANIPPVSTCDNVEVERVLKPQAAKRKNKENTNLQDGDKEGTEKPPPAKRGRKTKTNFQSADPSQTSKGKDKMETKKKRRKSSPKVHPPQASLSTETAYGKSAPRTKIRAAIVSPQKESETHLEWARAKFDFFPEWSYDQPGTGDVNCFHHCPELKGKNLKKILSNSNFKEGKDYFLHIDDMKDFARSKFNWIDPYKRAPSRRVLLRKRY